MNAVSRSDQFSSSSLSRKCGVMTGVSWTVLLILTTSLRLTLLIGTLGSFWYSP